MNPEQLAETTMNKDNRILRQINIESLEESTKLIKDLMGKDVNPRKEYIFKNGGNVSVSI